VCPSSHAVSLDAAATGGAATVRASWERVELADCACVDGVFPACGVGAVAWRVTSVFGAADAAIVNSVDASDGA